MKRKAMIVAGIMSGTSADGIDVALIQIGDSQLRGVIELIGHAAFPYPPRVRQAVLAAMNADRARVADLARLNFVLGHLYADAVLETQRKFRAKPDLIGCHGQTLYHQGEPELFLGKRVAATWQTGEAAIIAARVGVPVVSDFRPADMAAGGEGAPLVPYLDYLLFRDARIGRIVLNVGGIANLTAIPANAGPERVIAFDTGPGNMVIDQVMHALTGRAFDRDGEFAASAMVDEKIVRKILCASFFRKNPPKTAGREEFGREFVRQFLQGCGRMRKQDIVATATALTSQSISDAVRRFVIAKSRGESYGEIIASGGGTRNKTLIAMLAESVVSLGLRLRFSDEFGVPSEAKEAVAFAVLAYETWNRRPSNIPAATGARKAAVLGKLSYA